MGCDVFFSHDITSILISIHAPRMGCDEDDLRIPALDGISIHAPRMGCDAE